MHPQPSVAPPVTVAICIATYLRPRGLQRLLESLRDLTFNTSNVRPEVIVVDNDESGSARPVVDEMRPNFPFPLRYVIEPCRGISFARNRAVRVAAGVQFLAFVDDDEVVHPEWLDRLVDTQRRFGADIVTGPVIPVFEHQPPAWVIEGRFYDRPRYRTGTLLDYARTGNVLIAKDILDKYAEPFDPFFALSGGEDTFLFMKLVQEGARIVWCDEAPVKEIVPPSRDMSWMLKRAYRVGNTTALCEKLLYQSYSKTALRLVKGSYRIVTGSFQSLLGLLLGKAQLYHGLISVARGFGMLAGVIGIRYDEYREIARSLSE